MTGDALATVIVSHTPAHLRSGSRTFCTHNIIAILAIPMLPQTDSERSRPKYWESVPDGSWKWTQRAPGEARWIKNHIKGVLFQKQKAESALSFAESAIQAASARYSETKSRDDLHSLTQAAADLHVKTTNLEWQLRKIEDLQKGWVTLDKNYESRWLTTDERDAVPHLLSQVASATETNPVLSATVAPAASSNPALSALLASEASAQPLRQHRLNQPFLLIQPGQHGLKHHGVY